MPACKQGKKLSLLSLLSLNLRKQRPSSRSTLSLARARRGRTYGVFEQLACVAACLRHKFLRQFVKFNLGFSFPLFRTFQYFFSFHIAPFFRKTHFLEALKGPLFLQPSTTLLAHLQHAPFCLASSRPMKKQSRYFYLFSFIKLRNKKSDATKITCFSDKYKQSDTKKRTMPFMALISSLT